VEEWEATQVADVKRALKRRVKTVADMVDADWHDGQ
jgi:hypothetical protein